MSKTDSNPIVIKKGLRIGDLEAETDKSLLKDVFVDSGDLDLLTDVSKPESIIIGRTGSGKSALLIEAERKVYKSVFLDPNHISISFIEQSDIIQFFEELGVNIDVFYRFLWKHILVIEFLKVRYNIKNENQSLGLWDKLFDLVGVDQAKKEALSYFRDWGGKFWLDSDEQLQEVTKKLSKDLQSGFGADLKGVELSLKGAKAISEEQKTEVVKKANEVVSKIQIQKLSRILDLLNTEIFNDEQKPYFILIDKLDENWAETNTRYRFIRALLEEIKAFRSINNIKIIISLRKDLLNLVLDRTRDCGFQQEKFESYFLHVRWNKAQLTEMVDKRVNEVFKRQYTNSQVGISDIFPNPKKDEESAIDFILNRTLQRPRDVLQFINECFIAAEGRPRVSWNVLKDSELVYSEKRLDSLYEEWGDFYPALRESLEFLRGVTETFAKQIIFDKVDNYDGQGLYESIKDPCGKVINDYLNNKSNASDVIAELMKCYFRVGAIGVKLGEKSSFIWSSVNRGEPSLSQMKRVKQIRVHKMLHRSLGIRTQEGW